MPPNKKTGGAEVFFCCPNLKKTEAYRLEPLGGKVVIMTRTGAGEENRNDRTFEFESWIIKIRDWIGFILTLAGFCLSLSGTVHINMQVQYNVTIEIYNNIPEAGVAQWNSEGYHLNMKDDADNIKRKISADQGIQ